MCSAVFIEYVLTCGAFNFCAWIKSETCHVHTCSRAIWCHTPCSALTVLFIQLTLHTKYKSVSQQKHLSSFVLIVTTISSMGLWQRIWMSAARANMDNSGARHRRAAVLNFAGIPDYNCKHKPNGNCCKDHKH